MFTTAVATSFAVGGTCRLPEENGRTEGVPGPPLAKDHGQGTEGSPEPFRGGAVGVTSPFGLTAKLVSGAMFPTQDNALC